MVLRSIPHLIAFQNYFCTACRIILGVHIHRYMSSTSPLWFIVTLPRGCDSLSFSLFPDPNLKSFFLFFLFKRNMFLSQTQWHRLNNIASVTLGCFILIFLMGNKNEKRDHLFRYFAFGAVWICKLESAKGQPIFWNIISGSISSSWKLFICAVVMSADGACTPPDELAQMLHLEQKCFLKFDLYIFWLLSVWYADVTYLTATRADPCRPDEGSVLDGWIALHSTFL